MKKLTIILLLLLFIIHLQAHTDASETEHKILPIEVFIELAVKNDRVFEEILVEELKIRYNQTLSAPAQDLIIDARSQYEIITSEPDNSGPEISLSLSKLFPYSGIEAEASYSSLNSAGSNSNTSSLSFLVSVPIASNAFGRTNELALSLAGIEDEIAEYQIVEAYEDYLASVITLYLNWYFAYENLNIAESSYVQSIKLLDNIRNREQSKIALAIDVNKIKIQTLAKKENLIKLREKYDTLTNTVRLAVRDNNGDNIIPVSPLAYGPEVTNFSEDTVNFIKTGRTLNILRLLSEKTDIELEKATELILPSASLFAGNTLSGNGFLVKDPSNTFYGGISVAWSPDYSKENALYDIGKIDSRLRDIKNSNTILKLENELKNLSLQIKREKELITLAEEKISLAESILRDETQNYTYGKVSLNDYIDAVNRLDEHRFNSILHNIELKTLTTEWLRITDRLISKKAVLSNSK